MKKIKVYHGGTDVIEHPLCEIGRPLLDFGKGFYITDIREQAYRWTDRMGRNRGMSPLINSYTLDRESVISQTRCKVFTA